jgi:TIR domain
MPSSVPNSYVPHGVGVLRTYGEGFAGRETELAALDRAWADGTRVFVLYAEGGMGKTRVVARWLTRVRDAGWREARRVFVHSFYSQGSDERRNASSELFFEQALSHFGHKARRRTDPAEKGRTLARLVVEQRGLLVLDGLEPLQHPPAFDQGRLKDPALYFLLLSLAAGELDSRSSPQAGGLCVATSRQPVVELQDKIGRTVVQQPLDRLDSTAGAELLRQLQVRGPERELRQAVEDARGHAYSLMLLGSYLRDATDDREIRRRHEIPLLEEDAEHRYHARHLFGAYIRHLGESSAEVAVLRLLGFFDRPADEKLLAMLCKAAESELGALTAPLRGRSSADWRRLLSRLTTLRLIDLPVSSSPSFVDSHPLLREYFAEQFQTRFPQAWQAGHRRLFEHLCATTEHLPASLAGLQPLYQAVAHGCLAGLHPQAYTIYHDRILRGTGVSGFYSTRRLGAIGADLGALANFFLSPWTGLAHSLEPPAKAWLLQEVAYRLRALGRLTEAAEPMQVGIEMAVEQNDWRHATIYSSNLSELELVRGELSAALAAAEQAVAYADRSGGDDESFIRSRTALADILHQAGKRAESRHLFEDVEARQAAHQPDSPWLHAVPGSQYCDLLLADAERGAWRGSLVGQPVDSGGGAYACRLVMARASRSLAQTNRHSWLLSIALDHLTLARAQVYEAVLSSGSPSPAASDHVAAALDGLHAASTKDHLPKGLLTRAWLRYLSGDEPGCRADLDEAWEIAERGPMPLFQADIELTRARLYHDHAALAHARRLIDQHGYHRRGEELADAEEVASGWGIPPLGGLVGSESELPLRDRVFISYSRRDKKFLDELLTHLKPYVSSGSVTAWSDQEIVSGAKWLDEIQGALDQTCVAVLLVSPDFLASDFIRERELGPLLREAEAGGVRILWAQLRACAFAETPLRTYQAVISPPEKPLAQKRGADRDEAWVRICKEIKKAVGLRTQKD